MTRGAAPLILAVALVHGAAAQAPELDAAREPMVATLTLDEAPLSPPADVEDLVELAIALGLDPPLEDLHVTPHQLLARYESVGGGRPRPEAVRISMIWIARDPGDPGVACGRAEELRSRIVAGALGFEEAGDPSEHRDGGGWLERGALLDPIETIVWAMHPGDVSTPVDLGVACVLFRLDEHRIARPDTFEEAQDALLEDLLAARRAARLETVREMLQSLAESSGEEPGKRLRIHQVEGLAPATRARLLRVVERRLFPSNWRDLGFAVLLDRDRLLVVAPERFQGQVADRIKVASR